MLGTLLVAASQNYNLLQSIGFGFGSGVEMCIRDRPSTLHIVLPEAYLGTPQEESRLAAIRAAMQDYSDNLLTRCVHGYVYVERTQMDGTIRQGLVGAVDVYKRQLQR